MLVYQRLYSWLEQPWRWFLTSKTNVRQNLRSGDKHALINNCWARLKSPIWMVDSTYCGDYDGCFGCLKPNPSGHSGAKKGQYPSLTQSTWLPIHLTFKFECAYWVHRWGWVNKNSSLGVYSWF